MNTPRVFLCPGDESGWAIDEDRRLTAASLDGLVEWTSDPEQADVIHACWWQPLMRLPERAVRGKPVICHMAGDPARCLGEPDFLPAMTRVTDWVAQSRAAAEKLRCLAPRVHHVPYAVDIAEFAAPAATPCDAVRNALAAIPAGAYVIASVHRDTAGAAFGPGMDTPKLVKGPDVFLEVVSAARDRGVPVVVLLAGPRRHWLRRRLRERGVPVVFAGREIDSEDYPANTLPREQVAHVYAAASLVATTSRSEGGPRCILEAAAAGRAQLSTPVGLAPDVLHPECLFTDPVSAAESIESDFRYGTLRRWAPAHAATVRAAHTTDANRTRWRAVYAGLGAGSRPPPRPRPLPPNRGRRVSFWNRFTPPPWGGGNQFMIALKEEAARQGVEVAVNGDGAPADGHIVNSVQFDMDRFRALVEPGSARVVHRIDGPISVLRGTPESLEQDRACFDFNRTYATATVIQSWHTVRSLGDLGFEPVRPALILNATDHGVFHRPASPAPPRGAGGPIRVIASAWSPSPGKGAAVYEWMDANLDPARFEFTFVGNSPVRLRRARMVPPLPSADLAALLARHDAYVTASRNDPCSNALIEALACGLPALYYDSGGHAELAQFGGLPFRRPAEIPALLERLFRHRDLYRNLIRVESMRDVCARYLTLLFSDAPYRT
ncbi:MAG: glycosyltransferase family 4 protein [Phycisphaerales bacterium]|nr:glycosyltransferase family 4 protein [Phycisphaerales bacterium]